MGKTKKSTVRYRRADNGQYTTEAYAKKHKKTTVKETDQPQVEVSLPAYKGVTCLSVLFITYRT